MKRFALIATILLAAAGCDKTKALLGLGVRRNPTVRRWRRVST